ncbi:MAG: hypothetical protein MUE44_05530 [Oscillatoriaceae cyanobacterium Prado104]|jgi:hypothetical protein|nr:hypothetical protein [Oscillatoriaceae cyanobacterium Prado104]
MIIPQLAIPPGYRPQAPDTSAENDALEFYLLRQRSNAERLSMGAAMTRSARHLSLHCLSRQFANLSPQQLAQKIALAWLQENCPPNFTPADNPMSWIQDSTLLALQLHGILESLAIPYYITGGVAAIAYGEPRTTRDLDVAIALSPTAIDSLVEALELNGFYVPGVEDIRSGRMPTLGITHIETISRADLMVAGASEFERLKFDRRRAIEMPEGGYLYFISPEDLVLAKLAWGCNSRSEKQWRDVLGILKVQAETLDRAYLIEWAGRLDIAVDLARALTEAGI